MPFIDSKVTLPMTEDKKETIKAKLGQAITTLNKSEGFLMVGFDDDYTLYMGGKKLEKGAFVAVSLFGNASPDAYSQMTAKICDIYETELGIPRGCSVCDLQRYQRLGLERKEFLAKGL